VTRSPPLPEIAAPDTHHRSTDSPSLSAVSVSQHAVTKAKLITTVDNLIGHSL
jgi:hypothetical protein